MADDPAVLRRGPTASGRLIARRRLLSVLIAFSACDEVPPVKIFVVNLLLLHPLPLDGSIFSEDLRALGDFCAAPTLYEEGDDIIAWAHAALDAIGDGPVVVVGNSIGGSCAIEVARLAPPKVQALILCGAKAGHRPEPDLRDEALQLLGDPGLGAAWERYWLPLFGPDVPADVVARAWRIAERQGTASIAAGVRAFYLVLDASAGFQLLVDSDIGRAIQGKLPRSATW